MAEAVITKIVVFDEGMYHGNGLVGRWMNLITDRFGREARHYAPVRSGQLRDGIFSYAHQIGPRQVQGIIESTSPHTMYVLEGTTGPIMSDVGWATQGVGAYRTVTIYRGPGHRFSYTPQEGYTRGTMQRANPGFFMRIPAWGGHRTFFALAVSGQAANNFMYRAWRATARDHRAIRGVSGPF
jgi:hypothetical protein